MFRDNFFSGFRSSQGPSGVYTLLEDNEVISFVPKEAGYIYVEAVDTDLNIVINNDSDIWYIPTGASDDLNGVAVERMQVMCPAGTNIFWKAYTI